MIKLLVKEFNTEQELKLFAKYNCKQDFSNAKFNIKFPIKIPVIG